MFCGCKEHGVRINTRVEVKLNYPKTYTKPVLVRIKTTLRHEGGWKKKHILVSLLLLCNKVKDIVNHK